MTQLFLLFELIFKAIGLWESFSKYVAQKRLDELADKAKDLEKAIQLAKSAHTEDEAYAAQTRISRDSR